MRIFVGDEASVKVGERYGIQEVMGAEFIITTVGAKRKQYRRAVVMLCDCGTWSVVLSTNLLHGPEERRTYSCGCANPGTTGHFKYGDTYAPATVDPIYRVWRAMINRCYKEGSNGYKNYGGRGISVCDEWRGDFKTFRAWAVANGWSDELEIDRQNNNGNYEPGNCRFVTRKVNCRNRRSTRIVSGFGESKSIIEWSEDPRCVVGYATLLSRISEDGMPVEQAMLAPSRNKQARERTQPIEAFGEVKTVAQWASDARCSVGYGTILGRLERGWDAESAISTPPKFIARWHCNNKDKE